MTFKTLGIILYIVLLIFYIEKLFSRNYWHRCLFSSLNALLSSGPDSSYGAPHSYLPTIENWPNSEPLNFAPCEQCIHCIPPSRYKVPLTWGPLSLIEPKSGTLSKLSCHYISGPIHDLAHLPQLSRLGRQNSLLL